MSQATPIYMGTRSDRYSVHHDWLKYPTRSWMEIPTLADVQGLTEDPETGELYLTFAENTKGKGLSVLPSVLVFDAEGNYIRRFAPEVHRGGHGIRFVKIGSEKFVYVTCVNTCQIYKYNAITGELLMTICKPEFYCDKKFKPTNVSPLKDGRFVVTDGYGSNYILLYSASGKLLSYFNGSAAGEAGPLNQPHGITVFDSDKLIIADRKNERLVLATLDGRWTSQVLAPELCHPCNIHETGAGEGLRYLIPGLWHSIGIYDNSFKLRTRLGNGYHLHGDGEISSSRDDRFRKALIRDAVHSAEIKPEYFLYPHDAIWTVRHSGAAANILVCEWNYYTRGTGVTLLRHSPA